MSLSVFFSAFPHATILLFLSLSQSLELSSDPGKTLPESLDYNVFWLQTVAGEVDNKTGIPPALLCLQIKDFLNGPGEEHTNELFNTRSRLLY